MNFSKKIMAAVMVGLLSFSGAALAETANYGGAEDQLYQGDFLKKVRINWDTIPGAVSYRLVILKGNSTSREAEIKHINQVPNNGFELDTVNMLKAKGYYWRVCPLDYDGHEMGAYSAPKPLVGEEVNPKAPRATTEFEEMANSPLYPVFSWIPVDGSGG